MNRDLGALMLASALVTLDGTAVTLALPTIGRALALPPASLHWVSDVPLFVLALLLVPVGGLADRIGHFRTMRAGLAVFAAGALLAALAPSSVVVIAARGLQGVGAAAILPSAFAVIRATIDDPVRQARKFGVLAGWTGAAAVAGPLIGGVLADVITWRAVFLVSAAAAALAFVMLLRAREITPRSTRQPLFPAQLMRARNCVAANVATFGLYFGVFGLPFVIAVFLQQTRGYSALATSLAILPLSVMMFFAAPFAKLSARVGSRWLVAAGSVVAAAGAASMALPVDGWPLWAAIVVGTSLFGLGVSIAVSPLTHAAVGAVGESCAGAASALNHAVVRLGGLAGIALLGALVSGQTAEGFSLDGFRTAMSTCGVVGAACGIGGAALLRDEEDGVI